MATYAQLKKQIEQLSKQAESARQVEKSATLAKIREAVAAFELTPEEVFGAPAKSAKKKASKSGAPKRTAKGAGQAKYRDPKTGATWTGFGRAPAWMASAKDRTKFLISEQTAVAEKPAAKDVTKPTKPVKKAAAKKAAPATKAKPVAKTAAKTKATVVKKVAPVAVNATAKAPTKKVVKVATAKTPSKASAKPLARAASAAQMAAAAVKVALPETPPSASPQVAV